MRSPIKRPALSLRRTVLLDNVSCDVRIASEIAREIPSADRIGLPCTFVRHSGLWLFRSDPGKPTEDGAQPGLIARIYVESTECRVLDALVDLGAVVRISDEVARTQFHTKAWQFHRDSGLHTAYVGSSNLTHTVRVDSPEWSIRVSAGEKPEVMERFAMNFEKPVCRCRNHRDCLLPSRYPASSRNVNGSGLRQAWTLREMGSFRWSIDVVPNGQCTNYGRRGHTSRIGTTSPAPAARFSLCQENSGNIHSCRNSEISEEPVHRASRVRDRTPVRLPRPVRVVAFPVGGRVQLVVTGTP